MQVIETELPGVLLLEPRVYGDARGFFLESWNKQAFADLGLNLEFVQDNHSRSARGVLRGLHYQLRQPQGKLVRVVSGAVFDVAVDLRRSSPHFGQWTGHELSAENHRMMWVPPGFGAATDEHAAVPRRYTIASQMRSWFPASVRSGSC